jgi:hypothetical protein
MRRYYFHFRKGGELTVDRRGMWLSDESQARKQAIQLWGALLAMVIVSGDAPEECEYEITNEDGETIFTIPFAARGSIH